MTGWKSWHGYSLFMYICLELKMTPVDGIMVLSYTVFLVLQVLIIMLFGVFSFAYVIWLSLYINYP